MDHSAGAMQSPLNGLGAPPNGALNSLAEEMKQYRLFDDSRNRRMEALIQKVQDLETQLNNANADIHDAINSRRQYQLQAQEAKDIISKMAGNQYAVLLVDGDGYKFNDRYFHETDGGAAAARELVMAIQSQIGAPIPILVNVYANRQGLAKTLYEADSIQSKDHLDYFFCTCSQSLPLFHFIDCGHGKERADAKLRGKFIANCSQPLLECPIPC